MKIHTIPLNSKALSPADIQSDDDLNKPLNKGRKETDPECAEDTEAKKECDAIYVTQALTDRPATRRGRSRNRDIDESISHKHVRDLSEFRFCITLQYHLIIPCSATS